MIIRKYIVTNMGEALTRIKRDLGPNAVIISQRKVKKAGLAGLFQKKSIEVTVAVDQDEKKENTAVRNSIEAIKRVVEKNKVESPKDGIIKEIEEMKNLLIQMKNRSEDEAPVKSELEVQLEKSDIYEQIIKQILEQSEKKDVRQVLKDMLPISKPDLNGTVVLVGPTGIGKTTTIAKLAGRLALIEKKKVGLITIDTYRIGAVEQLRTYADIMNIPFKVVLTIKELETAIEEMKDCNTILIDTTGRSSKNTMQISELRAFIEKAKTDNIHLVLSCTTKNKDIETIIEGYKAINYNHVIITKLDETSTYGSILNIAFTAKKPISFLTTGQNVPDDIKEPDVLKIISLLLGEENIC